MNAPHDLETAQKRPNRGLKRLTRPFVRPLAGMIVLVILRLANVIARRMLVGLVLLARSDAANVVEILLLRHQLAVLQREARRPG